MRNQYLLISNYAGHLCTCIIIRRDIFLVSGISIRILQCGSAIHFLFFFLKWECYTQIHFKWFFWVAFSLINLRAYLWLLLVALKLFILLALGGNSPKSLHVFQQNEIALWKFSYHNGAFVVAWKPKTIIPST